MTKPKVLITVPNQMWLHKHVVFCLLHLQNDNRLDKQIILPTHRPLENNLHHIIKEFLEGDYTHWLSIDADNPPTKNPLDLVFLDLDIVGCPTPVLHIDKQGERPLYLNALDWGGNGWTEHNDKIGLQEVDAIGGGCFVISRRVLEKLKYKQPFQRTYNRDGTVEYGNDYSFSKKAKEAGFKLFAHYDYLCRHFVEVDLLETWEAFYHWKLN